MSAIRNYIVSEFAKGNMTVDAIDFAEDETIRVVLDSGRVFIMEVGSDDDMFVFVDEDDSEYEFSFEMPEEGFED